MTYPMIPRIIFFDLDNTLAESKQAISPTMAMLLEKLLTGTHVAITSGGRFEQLHTQVASKLGVKTNFENLHLLPTSGAALYAHEDSAWVLQYQLLLTSEESSRIETALQEGAESLGLIDFSQELYGPYIENRGSQVSLSALGQHAPVVEKRAWDPDHVKRRSLQTAIAPLLQDFDVKVGGLTTIDVTKHGINKAYGVRELCTRMSVGIEDTLYIGDELSEGGNDAVVKETGMPTRQVAGPMETTLVIQELLST